MLLEWAKACTQGYKGIAITNFQLSWKDGMAFCALVHAHYPKLSSWPACRQMKPLERLNHAFEAAASVGVPQLLDAEDVCDIDVPEKLSMITYMGVLHSRLGKLTPQGPPPAD
jgi:hypothetical protein